MDGNVPIRLWDSKVGLSVPSPLAVLLAFFANKCLESGFDDSEEELGFVLASLLSNYDVIYGYSFADFVSVLRVSGLPWVSVRTTRSADHSSGKLPTTTISHLNSPLIACTYTCAGTI